jgi:hypothetical protein
MPGLFDIADQDWPKDQPKKKEAPNPDRSPPAPPDGPVWGPRNQPLGFWVGGVFVANNQDALDVIRTIAQESKGEPDIGQGAVAGTIKNRSEMSGETLGQVVRKKSQYSPWKTPQSQAALFAIQPSAPEFQRAARNGIPVLAGASPDPSDGATHFINPEKVPDWPYGRGQPSFDIGRHRFYRLQYERSPARPPTPGFQPPWPDSPNASPSVRIPGELFPPAAKQPATYPDWQAAVQDPDYVRQVASQFANARSLLQPR